MPEWKQNKNKKRQDLRQQRALRGELERDAASMKAREQQEEEQQQMTEEQQMEEEQKKEEKEKERRASIKTKVGIFTGREEERKRGREEERKRGREEKGSDKVILNETR